MDATESLDINKKNLKCAPTKQFQDGSCIPLELLIEMAKAYNDVNKNNPIKMNSSLETLNPPKLKKYLIMQFNNRLNKVCENQICWIQQNFINRMDTKLKTELKKNTFRPKGPNNSNKSNNLQGKFAWLNTYNINDVMTQYESKYKDFKYLGTVPIDFDDLPVYGIKKLNFDKLLESGKNKLGIIFNLDEHYKSGSHWVAAYTDLKDGIVYFFDSYGIAPEPRIRKLLRKFARYIKDNMNKNPKVDFNRIRHQYSDSECGVYSINFILRLLKGELFTDITKNITPDKEINKCRDVYFI